MFLTVDGMEFHILIIDLQALNINELSVPHNSSEQIIGICEALPDLSQDALLSVLIKAQVTFSGFFHPLFQKPMTLTDDKGKRASAQGSKAKTYKY